MRSAGLMQADVANSGRSRGQEAVVAQFASNLLPCVGSYMRLRSGFGWPGTGATMNVLEKLRAGVTTSSAGETRVLAAAFAATLPPDPTIALHGTLGVGKTTFVQGLARGLGIRSSITSPTFNIFTLHRGPVNLLHLDAYRLESAREVEDLLLSDFMISPWCLAVEWPEKIADWLPPDTLHLELAITADERHTVRLR